MDEYQNNFTEEVSELIENLEQSILNQDVHDFDLNDIAELFRVVHTIKGTAAMFGFANMGAITHLAEEYFQLVREEKRVFDEKSLEVSLLLVDLLKSLIETNDSLVNNTLDLFNNVKLELNVLLDINTTESHIQELLDKESSINDNIYYVRYSPDRDVLNRGIEPLSVFDELNELGSVFAVPDLANVPDVEDYNTEDFFLAWDIFVAGTVNIDDIKDVFMFFMSNEFDISVFDISKIKEQDFYSLLNARVLDYGLNSNYLIEKIGQLLDKEIDEVDQEPVEYNEERQEVEIKKSDKIQSIKVNSLKLDELINLVSELVTINSQLETEVSSIENDKLKKTVKQLSKLSKQFRDNALSLRLIPVKVLVLRMQRVIRDLSSSLGKKIEFITEGTNTELDKSIVGKLEGPILHIIRNCIDHAIETPDERLKNNKPESGVIRFISFYSGANVFVQIQDDGIGIDVKEIKNKAIQKGIIKPDAQLSDKELLMLIFEPGFSTASQVTNISGRGVGLDSVKTDIAQMRGQIDVDTEVGLGTSFTIKLPITLSIIDTLMTKVGKYTVLIPIEFIVHTAIFTGNSHHYSYNDKLIPVIDLRREFAVSENANSSRVVIVRQYDYNYAIVVDNVRGEFQAVVKPLGTYNNHHRYFSGSSILGNGELALILDINRLLSIKDI